MELRNIGIFAHVDAGKTTLSEQMLLRAGAIREAGSVDSGTAHTDNLPVEQRRGISVKATCVSLLWRGVRINLIDTPGHADFAAEIERSLWALDGAVLVVSAADGVQPQTELLYETLHREGIPVLFFLNKTDREGADAEETLRQIRRLLTPHAVMLGGTEALLDGLTLLDEALAERWLNGETFPEDELRGRLADFTLQGLACPVLTGSALRGKGVTELLDAIVTMLPPPSPCPELCGVVFAVRQDRTRGSGLWVRLYGGRLENRQPVDLPGRIDPATGEAAVVQQKIFQISDVDGTDTGRLEAGGIGLVYGLGSVPVGHVFGNAGLLPRNVRPGSLREPLMTVQVIPEEPGQMEALRAACAALSLEDPLLQAEYSRSTGELHLHVMGGIQLEILEEQLLTRFGLKAGFGKPTVIYRETVAGPAEGFAAYTMPKPCWAVLKFLIEPAPRGSGISYHSEVPVRLIAPGYQHQVEQALPLALKQGRLGWPVTDVNITLIDGNHHLIHTHPLDFIVATPWAIQDGLQRAGSVLLEPILEARLFVPQDCIGRIMSDVAAMRGEVLATEADGSRAVMTALIPAAESMDYPERFAAATGGRGGMSIRLHGYRECPPELGASAPRRGVDPLDTSRYILAARSALDGGIFDEA